MPEVKDIPYTQEGELLAAETQVRSNEIKARLWDEMRGGQMTQEGPPLPPAAAPHPYNDEVDRENLRAAMAQMSDPEFKRDLAYKLADLDNERRMSEAPLRADLERRDARFWEKYAPGGPMHEDFMDAGRPYWTRSKERMGTNPLINKYDKEEPWGAPLGPREQEEMIQVRRDARILEQLQENEDALRGVDRGAPSDRWSSPEWVKKVYGGGQ